ncbi:MAG: DNA polymerase III subunit delta [Proteobacteria bacterium]|nr:DNA polymerase III subunit delta [Pseudomonadota bacterium]
MSGDLHSEAVLGSLEKGRLAPFYLFYGSDEFRLERVLGEIRRLLIPESARDFNIQIFYGDDADPGVISSSACSIPFMAKHRLIIVRRTEDFSKEKLEKFLPYLERPCESTCLIFVCSKPDFKRSFYKTFRAARRAVNFEALQERDILPWIKRTAREIGLKIDGQVCVYLHQMVGNNTRELYVELEKLHLRYGGAVGIADAKGLVIHSRIYTIFELMDQIAAKNGAEALTLLNRFLEEEEKRAGSLRVIGMLNRQVRLLFQTKVVLEKGGGPKEVAKKLGPAHFLNKNLIKQSRLWSLKDLERGLGLLYQADGWLKSGSRPKPVLENLIISLCI